MISWELKFGFVDFRIRVLASLAWLKDRTDLVLIRLGKLG
jgi:hypothetical protein